MKKKNTNKRTLYVLIPLLGLSMLAFILLPRTTSNGAVINDDFNTPSAQSNYDVDDQKHEAPANHEPVLISVFKFIVNCNPFKKEA